MHYLIGDFVLDLERLELRQHDTCICLRPKLLKILRILVENRHRVVTKQELFDHVWNDTVVSEATLSTSIKELRQLFGDDGTCQQVIQTRRGAGFRFVAPVQPAASAAEGRHQTVPAEGSQREQSSKSSGLSASEEPAPYSGVSDERKSVSVLVCGLSAEGELAAALGEDALHELRRRMHAAMQVVANRFQGTVQRTLNADVLLFGAPRALEDHMLHAVRAALQLRAALMDGAPPKGEVGLCTGIATGQVLVGPSGNQGVVFTPVDNVFEQAVALRNQARPGQVLLSDALRQALQGTVRVQAAGDGFELLAVVDGGPDRPAIRGRFIGRQRELSLLADLNVRHVASKDLSLDFAVWANDSDDTLSQRVVEVDGVNLRQRYNTKGSLTWGAEAAATRYLTEALRVELSAAWQDGRVERDTNGERPVLLQRPDAQLRAALDWQASARLDLRAEVLHTASAWDLDDDGALAKLPDSTSVNLRGFLQVADWHGRDIRLTASIDNLTDESSCAKRFEQFFQGNCP